MEQSWKSWNAYHYGHATVMERISLRYDQSWNSHGTHIITVWPVMEQSWKSWNAYHYGMTSHGSSHRSWGSHCGRMLMEYTSYLKNKAVIENESMWWSNTKYANINEHYCTILYKLYSTLDNKNSTRSSLISFIGEQRYVYLVTW